MRGSVEIHKLCGDDKILVEQGSSNMLMDNAGSLIIDMLTANPDLSGIDVASSILDASNYTIHALSFGKGSQGYSNHAHSPNVSSMAIASGAIVVIHLEGNDTSSYQTSDADLKTISHPSPQDTRLEMLSTEPPLMKPWFEPFYPVWSSEQMDIGHNLNIIHTSAVNGFDVTSVLLGCYAAGSGAGGTTYVKVSGNDAYDTLCTSTLVSKYNSANSMDTSGFINMIVSDAGQGGELDTSTAEFRYGGLIVKADWDFSSTGEIHYQTWVSGGDLGAAALYGGIYAMGLWYIDMKTLLAEGKNPPYEFNHLNNQRKYKLFCKKVYSRDLTHHADSDTFSEHPGGLSSFSPIAPPEFNATYRDTLNTLTVDWIIEV